MYCAFNPCQLGERYVRSEAACAVGDATKRVCWFCLDCRKKHIDFHRLFTQTKLGFLEAKKSLEAVIRKCKQCHGMFAVGDFLRTGASPRTPKKFSNRTVTGSDIANLGCGLSRVKGSVGVPLIDLLSVDLVDLTQTCHG